MKILIKNGRLIDPMTKTDKVMDLLIENDIVKAIGKNLEVNSEKIIDATGYWVVPGLIDVHVHLREPGYEYKETILSGSCSGAKGGFTTICCMPNTNPVIDNKDVVEFINKKAQLAGVVNVLPIGSITKGQRGEEVANLHELKRAGICGISEDGKTVINEDLLNQAMKEAKSLNLPVLSHCEDHQLAGDGVMNKGKLADDLRLKGIPTEAEESIILRDINLAKKAGCKLHICHVSTKGAVGIIRLAKLRGEKVTAEVCPHHFSLTEEAVGEKDPNFKMNPPLRGKDDVEEILMGLKDGTIDIIATDHAPHHLEEKALGFEKAPFGVVGLETAVALGITELVEVGILTPMELIEKMSSNPAKLLGIDGGSIRIGNKADIAMIDPKIEYEINVDEFSSKGKNSSFHGKRVKGKVIYTIVNGRIVVEEGQLITEIIEQLNYNSKIDK